MFQGVPVNYDMTVALRFTLQNMSNRNGGMFLLHFGNADAVAAPVFCLVHGLIR